MLAAQYFITFESSLLNSGQRNTLKGDIGKQVVQLLMDIIGLLAELIAGGDRVNIDTLVDYSLVPNIEVVIFLKYTQVHFDVLVQYSMLLNIEAIVDIHLIISSTHGSSE